MDEAATVEFAFERPPLPFLPAICCTCLRLVYRSRMIAHMNDYHPGWLRQWNQALEENGIE